VIRPGAPIAEGTLSSRQAAGVIELAEAAGQTDGVSPLSEHALLHVRRGNAERARDLVLTVGDTVAGYAHLDIGEPGTAGADLSGELVVHPSYRQRGFGTALVTRLIEGTGGHGLRLWAHGDLPAASALAQSAGFTRVRALWQMRISADDLAATVSSPVFPSGVVLRTFRPGEDEEAWLGVNQRAFAHHPEQGSWTRQDLELREAEPWFDPDGFFLAERNGRVIGFHWTKVHPAEGDVPPIGEVYVVGVDPGQQGGGLGRALTLAGIAYLRDRGLDQVMLYVDEDNAPAVQMYSSLGFSRWHIDVMYRHP
jgi:mycothiol synthase